VFSAAQAPQPDLGRSDIGALGDFAPDLRQSDRKKRIDLPQLIGLAVRCNVATKLRDGGLDVFQHIYLDASIVSGPRLSYAVKSTL
jgi:hypothetical protein